MRNIRSLHVVVLLSAFLGFAVFIAMPCRADGSRITVTFYEGHFQEAGADGASKYSALVSVWYCTPEFKELGQFRGSTLPNPYWVYRDLNQHAKITRERVESTLKSFHSSYVMIRHFVGVPWGVNNGSYSRNQATPFH